MYEHKKPWFSNEKKKEAESKLYEWRTSVATVAVQRWEVWGVRSVCNAINTLKYIYIYMYILCYSKTDFKNITELCYDAYALKTFSNFQKWVNFYFRNELILNCKKLTYHNGRILSGCYIEHLKLFGSVSTKEKNGRKSSNQYAVFIFLFFTRNRLLFD